MLQNTIERNFIVTFIVCFFLMAVTYNLSYFYTFGDSLSFFLYVPITFVDLLKTGLMSFLFVIIFLLIFKNIFIDPVFKGEFPNVVILLIISALVFISNLFYFLILDQDPNNSYYFISEMAFFAFSLVAFFGILYFFAREQSKEFLLVAFFSSMILISFFIGWLTARVDMNSAPFESKSKILLNNDKIISASILRSFDKGILVLLSTNSDINFIPWSEIKEAKFKKVTGL